MTDATVLPLRAAPNPPTSASPHLQHHHRDPSGACRSEVCAALAAWLSIPAIHGNKTPEPGDLRVPGTTTLTGPLINPAAPCTTSASLASYSWPRIICLAVRG